jgi:uncharacterized protein YoxC
MSEIPTWWLVLSGVFFFMNILFFVAMTFAMLALARMVKNIQPQISGLSTKVHGLIDTVENVAKRVEEVAASVRQTVEGVGGRAQGVIGSAEVVAHSASKQFEKFSPFVVGALTAMRLVKALNEMRHGRSAAQATKKKTLERRPASRRFNIPFLGRR